MLLTGDSMNGVEAERIGWASRSVPYDKLEEETNKIAERLALLPHDGIAIGKATNHLICDILGFNEGLVQAYLSHTLFTNLRWESDEYNFDKQRKEESVRDGILVYFAANHFAFGSPLGYRNRPRLVLSGFYL